MYNEDIIEKLKNIGDETENFYKTYKSLEDLRKQEKLFKQTMFLIELLIILLVLFSFLFLFLF